MISSFVISVVFVLLIDGTNCSNLGLISPIEVVEEWGCHDTEIRLTCGHLDSKLAILEATFTPNCTDEDCLDIGIKRLTGGLHAYRFSTSKTTSSTTTTTTTADPIIMETEAARKFLETLRQTHKNDDEITENDDEGTASSLSSEQEQEKIPGNNNEDTLKQDPLADTLISNKKKRTSLRTSLERLIERYLRKLSPNMNSHDDCGDLVKRSVTRFKRGGFVLKRDDVDQEQNHSHRTIIGARNITINESVPHSNTDDDNDEIYRRRIQESRTFCPEQRHRVSSLDRFHLEHSYKNDSKQEFNIRKTINHRCSGRNHCSFIFALDHPYSKIWDSGVVRIKYLCMEDFRINRYCNEHLAIGHEIDTKTSIVQPVRGEPVAEARIQLRESSFHSLKILKSGDEDESLPGFGGSYHHASDSRKRKIKVETPIENVQKQQAQGVYSQDFKILKILPNNIDDFNDIERIGDEIYIRTDDDILNVPEAELGEQHPELLPVPTALIVPILPHVPSDSENLITKDNGFPTISSTIKLKNNLQVENIPSVVPSTITDDHEKLVSARNSSQDFSKFENITIIIREGEQYVIKFPSQPRIVDNLAVNASTSFSSSASNSTTFSAGTISTTTKSTATEVMPPVASESSVTSSRTFPIFETDRRHEENTTMPFIQTVRDTAPAPTVSQIGLSDLSVEASNRNYKGADDDTYDTSKIFDDNDDDDEDEEYEDEFIEIDGKELENEEKEKNRITYTSIKRVSYRRPLLHGFSMTPGYPKFYVGEWECKSVISAPIGQKIRITILDISIRYDEECRDFLRIVDLEFGQTLFNSCAEAIRPIEVISISNQVEVIMKATSKFAFPKRGILIHYSALGCIDLPPPMNGHLVERNENTAIYECDPAFVFPDSAVKRRQLFCTERHTWDKILPDCIEKLAVIGSGIISGLNLNSYKKPSVQETTISKSSINPILKMPTGAENQISNQIKDTNVVTDVIVPLIIIGVLFIINGIVFYYIRLHRKRQSSQQVESRELAEL